MDSTERPAQLSDFEAILRQSPEIARMLDSEFWDARTVRVMFRRDGKDIVEDATWLKTLWYAVRGRWDVVDLSK